MKLSRTTPRLARMAGAAVPMTGLAGTPATGASASVNFPGINQKAAPS